MSSSLFVTGTKERKMNGLKISWETADNITIDNLADVYAGILKDMQMYDNGSKWMHADDVVENKKLLKALKRILRYYGKDVDTLRVSDW